MIRRLILASVLVCAACGTAAAQGLDGLFLEMQMRTGSIETNHYFFLPDGRYLNGVPEGGLTVAGFDLACAKPEKTHSGSSRCGTYKLTGAHLVFTPRQGPIETLPFVKEADGNFTLDAHFNRHVATFPAGATLDGYYARVNSGGGASVGGAASPKGDAPAVGYSEGFAFRPDGTFSTKSRIYVNPGGFTESQATGTYRLSGNVLELVIGGKTTRMIAYPYDLGRGDVRLNLNGEFFKK